MEETKTYTTNYHSKYKLLIHVVFVTKYRKQILEKLTDPIIYGIEQVCSERDCSLVTYEHDQDHIHMLIEYPPKHKISFLVKLLKQRTTYNCWQYDPHFMRINYWSGKHILWSDGYFACSTGDASSETIKKYIENQG